MNMRDIASLNPAEQGADTVSIKALNIRFARMFWSLRTMMRDRVAMQQLGNLLDHQLQDIGLERKDIQRALHHEGNGKAALLSELARSRAQAGPF